MKPDRKVHATCYKYEISEDIQMVYLANLATLEVIQYLSFSFLVFERRMGGGLGFGIWGLGFEGRLIADG
jgi:hypothetical protein